MAAVGVEKKRKAVGPSEGKTKGECVSIEAADISPMREISIDEAKQRQHRDMRVMREQKGGDAHVAGFPTGYPTFPRQWDTRDQYDQSRVARFLFSARASLLLLVCLRHSNVLVAAFLIDTLCSPSCLRTFEANND